MAYYIKVNPLVAEFLHLKTERNKTADGNYLLWQADMLAFGPMWQMRENAQKIGALVLSPREAKEETDGFENRPLPVSSDDRFILKSAVAQEAPKTEQKPQEEAKPQESNSDTESATAAAAVRNIKSK